MFPTTQATFQLVSIFGGNYIAEQHGDATQWCLASDRRQHAIDFDKLLKTLRSALLLPHRRSA